MKSYEIGSCGPYTDIRLNLSKTPNKYGSLYYFNERIYLTKNTPTTNYSVWSTDSGVSSLVLNGDAELLRELRLLIQSIKKVNGSMNFKEYAADELLFVKLGKDCEKIPANCELSYCISVFGVFKKTDGQAFL